MLNAGATLIKGFNRGLGTLVAGILAFFFAMISQLAGKWNEVVIIIGVFIVGLYNLIVKKLKINNLIIKFLFTKFWGLYLDF